MGMLETILASQGGNAVGVLAQRFGIPPAQAQSALEALLPAIQGGFKGQAGQGGLDAILGQLGGHARYADEADAVSHAQATDDGNAVLGQIFGSKDVSRTVAAQAAQSTGLGGGLLKQMLPVIAAMAAGALAKQAGAAPSAAAPGGGGILGNILGAVLGGGQQAQPQGGLGGLAQMLDLDKDGNPLDDIMGMAGKVLGR
jgi:hypothetical protein